MGRPHSLDTFATKLYHPHKSMKDTPDRVQSREPQPPFPKARKPLCFLRFLLFNQFNLFIFNRLQQFEFMRAKSHPDGVCFHLIMRYFQLIPLNST